MTVFLLVLSMASGGLAVSDQRIVAAAKARDNAAVRRLIAQHADVNVPQGGARPRSTGPALVLTRHGALQNSARDAALYCLELHNDINAVNSKGQPALHGAVYFGGTMLVPFLVEHGAKIDAVNKGFYLHRTPRHRHARRAHGHCRAQRRAVSRARRTRLRRGLRRLEKKSGVIVSAGDAVFIRTGRWARRAALGPQLETAGLDPSVPPGLKRRDVAVLGGELALDPSPPAGSALPRLASTTSRW